jgi:hypothetical protein
MGLREYLEKQPEDLNLYNLSIKEKEKEKELIFDPEKEITKTDWQGIKENLEQFRQNKNWGNFSSQAMKMKILAAEQVRITDQGIECTMSQKLENFREEPPRGQKEGSFEEI